MDYYRIRVNGPVTMDMAGKFISPSPEWMHMNRTLSSFELFVQTSGVLYIASDKERHVLNKGDFLLMPPGTVQFGYQKSECSFYWLHFTTRDNHETLYSEEQLHYEPGSVIIPQSGSLRSPDKLIVLMKQLHDSIRSYREQTLNNYMTTSILCELYNQLFFVQNHARNKQKQQQLFNDIVDYIKWNRHMNLKVSQIADYFGYNAKHLSHLFSAAAGISIKQYMLQEKMEAAKSLLTDTNQNINEISLQLGYIDSHPFMKCFKRLTGLTPTEYRNAYANRLINH